MNVQKKKLGKEQVQTNMILLPVTIYASSWNNWFNNARNVNVPLKLEGKESMSSTL